MITYHFALFPDKEQQEKLWSHANRMNRLYNEFLNERIEAYKKDKTKITWNEQQAKLVPMKQNDEILAEIHAQVLQQVPLRLKKSYDNFFRRCKSTGEAPGFPKFRSCKNFFGITYPQSGYYLDNNKIFRSKVYGKIRYHAHRKVEGEIKQVNITCDNRQNWYLNITTDFIVNKKSNQSTVVGIDIGLTHLVVDSNGNKIKNQTHSRYFDKQIEKLQSRRDKKIKGSREEKRLSGTIRRLYDVKINKVDDSLHKVSKTLAREYDTIYVEDLSSKKMSESDNSKLNKAIRNAKFGQFISFLQYKCFNTILVNPYNTSKTCNHCGRVYGKLKLSDRIITCKNCNKTYDRDENAAKNILCLGQAMQYLPTYTGTSLTIQKALSFSWG